MMLPINSTPEEWREGVKHHAKRIRDMVRDTKLFGKDFKSTDMDAVLVAGFLAGVAEGRKNSEKILAELVKQMQPTQKEQ